MSQFKRITSFIMTGMLCFTCVFPIKVTAQDAMENLALHKTAVASSSEADSVRAGNAVDGDTVSRSSRWGSDIQNAPHWLYVDLGETKDVKTVRLFWENRKATAYRIQVANGEQAPAADSDAWEDVKVFNRRPETKEDVIVFDEVKQARYVRLYIDSATEKDPDSNESYNTVSIYEIEIYSGEFVEEQDPQANVALHKTGVSSSSEDSNLVANKAFDGNTKDKASRWSSAKGAAPHWIYVDLGTTRDVKTVRLFWEQRKATKYRIQVANTDVAPAADSADWKDVKVFNDYPSSKEDKIILDEVEKARFVRLYIDESTPDDPDGGVSWNTVSIYEMEVYGGELKETMADVANKIQVTPPTADTKKLEVNIPETDQYDITYNGTDYEQIVDRDLTIYQPVVNKQVSVSFKIVNKENASDYMFKEIAVVVPGKYQTAANDNAAPKVLPELTEWKGTTGTFTPTATSKIVYQDDALKATAEAMAKDYELLTGKELKVVKGSESNVAANDFFFALTTDKTLGLQKEGYLMNVESSKVNVTAETTTGAYWATRTILQSIKQDGNVPCGIARDYPLYEIRGFILDVGRKTFTLDYLEQVVQQMAWYKMNDFQVHLNDNLIPLENYSNSGQDPMDAYSAFRLESETVKKGGNNGLNQQDLTSTDLFYTKDEFRNFIKESRTYGVNIVPEIDTPAHSLALTKVRPDLRHGTYGRENDHLALRDKYDECLAFVQGIFDEYMKEANPVFDEDTIVHVGADEYNADKEAYRRFSDDMLKYVQDTGRTARIWGSLSQCRGETPVRSKDVQMNLWNFGYANMDEMYELGYDLINCNDGNYYVVPNAGYYYDYLNDGTLYDLAINSIGGVTIPAGDEQMIGGAFAVWNDMTDYLDNGVSEYDVYDRIDNAIPLFGAKLWGKQEKDLDGANELREELGTAPDTNFGYEVESKDEKQYANYEMDSFKDASANKNDLKDATNADIEKVDGKKALHLNGGESYVSTGIETAGLGNSLRVKVKRTSDSTDEQILFESPYGSIKAVQKETGKVGFSRERFDYSFSYELPVNEWVELEFKNAQNVTQLYVNGKLMDTLGDGEQVEGRPLRATTMIPFATIGSKTNAFEGYVDDVRLGKNDEYGSSMELDYAIWNATEVLVNMTNDVLEALLKEAAAYTDDFVLNHEKIAEYVNKINDLLKELTFEKANYDRVNAYLAIIPEDLSVFTEESVQNLEKVIANIREDLPKSLQDVVDGYETVLEHALNGLTLKEHKNVNYIDPVKLNAKASSYQNGEGPEKAIDDNLNTMWHSAYDNTTMPHWIELSLKEGTAKVNGLTYVPRQNGSNGIATEYQIQIPDGNGGYRTIKEGNLDGDNKAKEITFDAVETTSVRFVIVAAGNNNGSAAEIKLHNANVKADVEGLEAIVDEAKAIENKGYTEVSWNVLQEAIVKAEEVLAAENVDADVVETMKSELIAAMSGLRLEEKPEEIPVDKTELEEAIAKAEQLNKEDYTEVSWKVFEKALAEAKAILADEEATDEDVVDAIALLTEAINQLEKKPTIKPEPDPDPEKPGEGETTPDTGDTTNATILFVMFIVAGGVLVVLNKNKIVKFISKK